MEDVKEHIKNHGVSGIAEHYKKRLKKWENVEINFCVTGDAGAGKSSFINTFRR